MNIFQFKNHILQLNEKSLWYTSKKSLLASFHDEEVIHLMKETLTFLESINAIEWTENGLDLFPSTVIFARSKLQGKVEALAAFEMCIRNSKFETIFQTQKAPTAFLPKEILSFLKQTILLSDQQLNPFLREDAFRILSEDHSFFSETLNVLYTKELFETGDHGPYKNQSKSMISFVNKAFILENIPKKGIPESRDCTKALQTFFKDTLMHEFDHECPICHINLSHMLIASHIKPFRDCAHIYEPAVHDNGLLHCRNHDYLFDQGYISFDDKGHLLISPLIKDPKRFHLPSNFILDTKWMTPQRKQFMAYHRKHLFRKNH